MKKIMILGASIEQVPAIVEAKAMGMQVIVVDMNPEAVGFKEQGILKEIISTTDIEKVLAVAKKHKIDGILTLCSDMPVRTVARVAREMHLPGISEEAAFRCTDKAAMRMCLYKHGVPIPRFYNVFTKEEYDKAIKQFEKRCVVKAVDNAGSRGIQLIFDVNNQKNTDEAFEYCKKFSHSGELVVEEFMEGKEVCVETLNVDGVCYPIQITDQLAKKPPYFTDAGYNQPSLLSDEIKQEIKRIAVEANRALGNFVGSSCTELIVTKEGPKVVEVGARLAGDYMTSKLVPLSTGVNMVRGVINIALGEYVDFKHKISKGSCIRYFMKPVVGVIKDIRGVKEAQQIQGIQEVVILKNIGDKAVELRSGGDRILYIISKMDTAEEAIEQCEKALNMIEVVVD